jgi:GNAT superfamily N-acetyltransferase
MLLRQWPTKPDAREAARRMLVSRFLYGRDYSEAEVSEILAANHTFGDAALLRRELVDWKDMERTPDGRRYWRTRVDTLPLSWSVDDIRVDIPDDGDIPRLESVFDTCASIPPWDSAKFVTPMSAHTIYTEGLEGPALGCAELMATWVLRDSRDGRAAGLCVVYHGYPASDVIAIPILYVRPDYQVRGWGQTFVASLLLRARALDDYRRVRVVVSLKDWASLRFWHACGFDRIVEIGGDAFFADDTRAHVTLERLIDPDP